MSCGRSFQTPDLTFQRAISSNNLGKSFWGPNYPKLRAVKAKYDPTGLFFVHHGVGSEEWSADGFTKLSPP